MKEPGRRAAASSLRHCARARLWPLAWAAGASLCWNLGTVASACTLVVSEQRSGKQRLRTALPQAAVQLSFSHSVLHTPVLDSYEWRAGSWVLIAEEFEGNGYGLPHTAGPGERLERLPSQHGNTWRLHTQRPVQPLVVRPLPAQNMRLQLSDGRQWRLGDLSAHALLLHTEGCPT